MEKRLYVFLGIAIIVGGFLSIVSHQSKKGSVFTQCCSGGCSCDNDKGNDTKNDNGTKN